MYHCAVSLFVDMTVFTLVLTLSHVQNSPILFCKKKSTSVSNRHSKRSRAPQLCFTCEKLSLASSLNKQLISKVTSPSCVEKEQTRTTCIKRQTCPHTSDFCHVQVSLCEVPLGRSHMWLCSIWQLDQNVPCPLTPVGTPSPLWPDPPPKTVRLVEDKEDQEELMNKEELMTLPTLQGTSHCSCLEHCFSFEMSGYCANQHLLLKNEWTWENRRPAAYMPFPNHQLHHPMGNCSCLSEVTLTRCYSAPATRKSILFGKDKQFCPNLTFYWGISAKALYPSMRGESKCTLIALNNLAEPAWININCHDRVLPHIWCFQYKDVRVNRTSTNLHNMPKKEACLNRAMTITNMCFLFKWTIAKVRETHKNFQSQLLATITDLHGAIQMFKSTNSKFPMLKRRQNFQNNSVEILKCEKYWLTHTCKQVIIASSFQSQGFLVLKLRKQKVPSGLHLYFCEKGAAVSILSRFDETDCTSEKPADANSSYSKQYPGKELEHTLSEVCRKLTFCSCPFYTTIKGVCVMYSIFNKTPISQTQTHTSKAQCSKGQMKNDLVVDWDFDWQNSDDWHHSEEADLIQLVLHGNQSSCRHPMEMSCRPGHSKCFNISQICHFSLDSCGNVFPCRNGGHLEDCKYFDCGSHFKCNNSYCLPWAYVCDNKWDCYNGEDEMFEHVCSNSSAVCGSMFKCRKIKACVPLAIVCDGVNDCMVMMNSCASSKISSAQACVNVWL